MLSEYRKSYKTKRDEKMKAKLKSDDPFEINIYSTPHTKRRSDSIVKRISKVDKEADDPEYLKIFNYWRIYDLLATIFAFIGLVCAVVNYEIDV